MTEPLDPAPGEAAVGAASPAASVVRKARIPPPHELSAAASGPVARVVGWCAGHPAAIVLLTLALLGAGVWAMRATPIDAVPDLSDVQVIVSADWSGRSPDLMERQVAYPLVTLLRSTPRVRTVRAITEPGVTTVYVLFEDDVDPFWARTRVGERLRGVEGRLPAGVSPRLGPDATGVGWVFQYALVDESGRHDLAALRSWQDWWLAPALGSVPGVAEVASIGGFVKQYQVTVDPQRLAAADLSLPEVVEAIRAGNGEVDGRVLEFSGREYMVRSRGTLGSIDDIESVVVRADTQGRALRVGDVADVRVGPDLRRGAAELDGTGEVVGGIVVMRAGEHARDVIRRVKARLAETAPSLPQGVRIVPTYDRSGLIDGALATLRRTLVEEAIVVAIVVLLFLGHVRSALVPILLLPVAVIGAFLPMSLGGVNANIMSLGGLALAVGVVVDAAIVMVENAYRRVSEPEGGSAAAPAGSLPGAAPAIEQRRLVTLAAARVARPIFYSLLVIVVSFVPVFLLEAQEGRLFRPLAFTKTAVMTLASVLSLTLVPVLMTWLVRGTRLRPEAANPLTRGGIRLYAPVLRWALRHPRMVLTASVVTVALTVPLAWSMPREFMPPLFEGTLLYMPTTPPGVALSDATRLLQNQDRLLRTIPEVAQVYGTVGRSTSLTDNSPMSMVNTTVQLRPRAEWRPGATAASIQADLDAALQLPGVPNVWTQPIRSRLDMLATGMQTPLGIKVFGTDLAGIDTLGRRIASALERVDGVGHVYVEPVAEGTYVDVEAGRDTLGRYGLRIEDVQMALQSAVGGASAAATVEGRERYDVQVRYARDFRDDPSMLEQVLVRTPGGAHVPLGAVARVTTSAGPAMIRNEDGLLTGYIYVNLTTRDLDAAMRAADAALASAVQAPPGFGWRWTGDYERQQRASARLRLLVPLTLALIFVLLWAAFRSALEAVVILVSVVFALTGGVVMQWLCGYPFSVAVWVGYLALFGLAVQTGIVMVMYLREALDARRPGGHGLTAEEIHDATIEGAVTRLRPKLMTVSVVMAGLLPIMWTDGIGSDVMQPIAAPIIGGMVTSTVHVLLVTPVLFRMIAARTSRRREVHP